MFDRFRYKTEILVNWREFAARYYLMAADSMASWSVFRLRTVFILVSALASVWAAVDLDTTSGFFVCYLDGDAAGAALGTVFY